MTQTSNPTDASIPAPDRAWFTHDRFGLFIHWGLYAMAARHEWVMQREKIEPRAYRERYFPRFDPDRYDPDAWAAMAARAGMKYVVITAKHHEGFCLWDSKLTDYTAVNSPAKRDLLRPLLEAFRKRGLRTGIYYSLIDWTHPDFIIDDQHALREHPDRDKLEQGRDQAKYAKYLHGQVRELLTDYGKIDTLFFDFSYPARFKWTGPGGRPFQGYKDRHSWDAEALVRMCRQLQPGILINDRLDLDDVPGGWDIKTPEQFVPQHGVTVDGQPVTWEACHTFSGSWGYARDEQTWKSPQQLVKILIDGVSKGGNLLMNVGPTARGTFDPRAEAALAVYAKWMTDHDRSIYGCAGAPADVPPAPSGTRYTYNAATRRLYVHLFDWPFELLHLPGLAGRVAYAQFLHDASEVRYAEPKVLAAGEHEHLSDANVDRSALKLTLPVLQPDAVVPVIELYLK
jgi:alpha-L-fucosidase